MKPRYCLVRHGESAQIALLRACTVMRRQCFNSFVIGCKSARCEFLMEMSSYNFSNRECLWFISPTTFGCLLLLTMRTTWIPLFLIGSSAFLLTILGDSQFWEIRGTFRALKILVRFRHFVYITNKQINRSRLVNILLCHANSSRLVSYLLFSFHSWTKLIANWSLIY